MSRTDAHTWILPMLDEVVWKQISYTGYQNTWLSDVNYPKYDGHIIVQSSDRDFVFNRPRTFETMYSYDSTDSTLFEQVEDVNMFVYRIDEKWLEDFRLIMSGRFSLTSMEYRRKIDEFWDGSEYIRSILNKTQAAKKRIEKKIFSQPEINEGKSLDDIVPVKDQEYYSKPIMERNTFGLVWTITEERKRLEEKEKKNQDG